MARSRRRRSRRHQRKLPLILALCGVGLLLGLALLSASWSRASPDIVARVLYSETAGCTPHERLLVAGVMQNRIGNPAFGNLPSLEAVVEQRGAFSCIGDPHNANWQKTAHPERMTRRERETWDACAACVGEAIPPAVGPSGRPLVYYHDKSIGMPAGWDNARWRAVREVVTEHFVFYSIVPAGRLRG